jgi:hypothetical protein
VLDAWEYQPFELDVMGNGNGDREGFSGICAQTLEI